MANVNPLHVLTAGTVMRPFDGWPARLETGQGELLLAGSAAAPTASLAGVSVQLADLEASEAASERPSVWRCGLDTPMQRLVQTMAQGSASFVVVDDAGEARGWVGERELFAALLR